MSANVALYHEKQHLMHCAVHTLNNLFQEPWADDSLMEDLAAALFRREAAMRKESGMGRMWVNPYKSLVPQVGYYDINVLLEALQLKDCHVSLHAVFNPKDPHAVARSIEEMDPSGVRGIVINRVAMSLLGGLYTSHHFYAVIPVDTASSSPGASSRRQKPTWYIIDSKSPQPEIIGGSAELATRLEMEAREHSGHVFVVADGAAGGDPSIQAGMVATT